MDQAQREQLTYALTLAGGIVLIVGAVLMLAIMGLVFGLALGSEAQGELPPGFPTWIGGFFGLMALIPVICGIITIVAARRYRQGDNEARRNGLMAVIAGAVGLIGGGGGFVGAGLAIAGGILMMTEPEDGRGGGGAA